MLAICRSSVKCSAHVDRSDTTMGLCRTLDTPYIGDLLRAMTAAGLDFIRFTAQHHACETGSSAAKVLSRALIFCSPLLSYT